MNRVSGIVIARKSTAATTARREVERRGLVDLRLPEGLDDAEHADERRVLLQADEVVQQRRDHAAHGLRDDHVTERLRVRQPERPRRRVLARVDGLDPCAVHLRHVRRVDEHERDGAPEELGGGNAGEAERRARRSRAGR